MCRSTAFFYALAVAGLLLVTSAESSPRQGQPTSAETKARMIQLVGQLESDPYVPNGKDIRREVFMWLADAPDVAVTVCPNVIGDIKKLKGDDGATLTVQLAFSEAKYILEHPDKATDQHAVNMAGVEGVLRTYESMKKAKPKLRIDEMDRLLQLQSSGQLDAFVDAGLAKCSSSGPKS